MKRGAASVGLVAWTFLFSWIALFSLIPSPGGRLYFSLARPWARGCLRIAGVRLFCDFDFTPNENERYLYIVNHESILDIVVLYSVLPKNVVMVAKHTLRYVPIFGWGMWLAGVVFLNRKNPQKAYNSLQKAQNHLDKQRSVLIFPEGTCGNGKALLPFKRGAFLLSCACRIKMIPVGLTGVYNILQPDHRLVSPGEVGICFGPPIDPPGSEEEIDSSKETARTAVEALKTKATQLMSQPRARTN